MDLAHVEKSVKKSDKKPIDTQAYAKLLNSQPARLSYEDYSKGRLAPAPPETISKERLNDFLLR